MAPRATRLGLTRLIVAVLLCAATTSPPQFAAGRRLQATDHDDFPPNQSGCDRNQSHSPYRLLTDFPAVEGNIFTYCFDVIDTLECDLRAVCCNKGLGVQAVELQVAPRCKASVKNVTVDGMPYHDFVYDTELGVLRVAGGRVSGPGSRICLSVRSDAACTNLDQICGSKACKYAIRGADSACCPVGLAMGPTPPPLAPATIVSPPPPLSELFPYCSCERDAGNSRYAVDGPEITYNYNATTDVTKVCFVVRTGGEGACTAQDHPCCAFNLHKVAFSANAQCNTSLLYSTVDGVKKAPFFQVKPYPVIKVTNINAEFRTAGSMEICLFLRKPCDRLSRLCPRNLCSIAIFNQPGSKPSCCPLTHFPG